MKKGLAIFSKSIVYLMAVAGLTACAILLPELARESIVEDPDSADLTYSLLFGAYVLFIPFFIALYHTYKLLNYINSDQAFSDKSVRALGHIKHCAAAFSVLAVGYAVFTIALVREDSPTDDVTHIATLGFIFSFTAIVITLFIAVLQKLLQDAIAIKADNDLIV